MRARQFWQVRLGLILGLLVCATVPTQAQQDPATANGEDQQLNANSTAPSAQGMPIAETPVAEAPTPGTPINTKVRPALRTVPWFGAEAPLRWGDLYVGDLTIVQVRDTFRPQDGTPNTTIDLSIFRTSFIFDKPFKKQDLVLQYEPQLAILNGQVSSNAGMNNVLTFGTAFGLTPRLTLTLKNGFTQVNSRQLFPEDQLAVDQKTGDLLQNNFLENAGSYISDEVSAAFSYAISPRSTIVVSPAYRYARLTNNQQLNYLENGQDFSTAVAWTRAMTARQNLGIVYTTEMLRARNGNGPSANTYFNTFAVFYGYQISRTYWIRGQFGENIATYPGGLPPVYNLGGSASLIKTFTRSELAVAYTRARMQTNFITAGISDRGDAVYTFHPVSRLMGTVGLGYYRELGGDPKTKGDYVASTLTYALSPKGMSLFTNYTYMFQDSTTPQLLSGTRNLFSVGFKWQPGPVPEH